MSSKTLDDLRERLFDAIDGVKNGTLAVDKARAINDLGQAVINSAKVEVDYLRVSAQKQSRFIGSSAPALPAPGGEGAPPAPATPLPNGIVGVRRHLMKDDD
jgi:hypothetical protein